MEIAKDTLIRTFGRTHGKKLSARQQRLVDNVLPTLAPRDDDAPATLEIGFGAGEHVAQLALAHPDKIIIGAEPFINGVASLLSRITDESDNVKSEYKNIRIWPDDVRKILRGRTFDQIWILHPDPWPKARHEKRRLLSSDFLKTLYSLISKDGSILIGTDHIDHYNWILEQVPKSKLQITELQNDNIIETRYQKKNLFGSDKTMYLSLTKS